MLGSDEEEYVGDIIPLFSTNILPQGKFYLPSGVPLVCYTRDRTHIDSLHRDSLFVDDVWPGSRVLAEYLVNNSDIFYGKYCLELGSGGALPSLVAAALGAKIAIISDYPAKGVIENIGDVITANGLHNATAIGHIWGKENTKLLLDLGGMDSSGEAEGYDVLFLAELLWKDTYSCHRRLLESLCSCLNKATGVALMTFAHRPTPDSLEHTPENDLEFFEVAASEYGLTCTLLDTCGKYNDVGENIPIDVYLYSMKFS